MKKGLVSIIGACFMVGVLVGSANADGGVSAKIGTLGYGAEMTVGIAPALNLRGGFNMMNFDEDFNEDDDGSGESQEINLEVDFQTYGLLLDLHPARRSGFRVTGGMMINNNEINMTADLDEKVEINDRDYYVTGLKGNISFDQLAPYVGIGYGNAVGKDGKWHFSCDFGVLVQGSPSITLKATASNPVLQERLNKDIAEEVKEIEDDAEDYKYWPVIALGVSYKF